jgi:H+-transporting ATPase
MVDTTSDASDAGSTHSSPIKSEPQVRVSVHNIPLDERPDVLFTPRRASRKDKEDDEEDEDLDALIEELESLDPDDELNAEVETVAGARSVPEELLQTDTRVGLIEPEVIARRKKYGLNQMRIEKENLLLKFLGYFVGPIQFVMEV